MPDWEKVALPILLCLILWDVGKYVLYRMTRKPEDK
jgi:hypothetical protein